MRMTPGSALALYDYLTSIWYFVYKNCSHVQTFGLLWWLCLKLPQSYLLNCALQWLHIKSYSVQRTLYRDFSWDYKRKKLVVSRSQQRYIHPCSITCQRNRSKKCALIPTSPWDEVPLCPELAASVIPPIVCFLFLRYFPIAFLEVHIHIHPPIRAGETTQWLGTLLRFERSCVCCPAPTWQLTSTCNFTS